MANTNATIFLFLHLLILRITAQNVATTITHTGTPVTITTSPSSTPPSSQYTDRSALQSAVLNSTNTYRRQHNASSIAWNDTLASYASDHVKACKFAHTGGPYGENLAEGYENMTAAIDGWGEERSKYNFDKGDFGEATGHFTQLVWKNTSSTGCGVQNCKDSGWLVFCEYWPQGNILGDFKENVQKQVNSDQATGGAPPSSPKQNYGLPKGYNSATAIRLTGSIWVLTFGLVTGITFS
ncbi:uncharacterized protein KY384_009005 [Bacidia gigantensis]|uniref:uncharacterized protein n=1 Tax=Bacidia gigantensis TaxID=2732470 RepID=UPI001D0490D7|nr:uncharacterized protein KY384_009005 [Bacidia gigantensis]KAG8525361.1 hypothetical protein KY384_009005 [Bacidia gigantensis]